MFKEAKDYIILAGVLALGLALYVINVITLNVVILGIVSVLLILVVLVQNPKGGGLDSTFGGNAGTQMFGAAQSTDFIERVTWHLMIALFLLCIVTTIMPSFSSSQALDQLGG